METKLQDPCKIYSFWLNQDVQRILCKNIFLQFRPRNLLIFKRKTLFLRPS